jgi:N-acetyl-beta-hexosaminidase
MRRAAGAASRYVVYDDAKSRAIMNKLLLTIIVALAAAFASVCASRAADNYVFKMMTCYHGDPRFSDGCSLPDKGRQYKNLRDCERTADSLNGNNRMDRHTSYKCVRKAD